MIIMLLLVWLSYFTRTFLFSYCPTTMRACASVDYFNNPGDALANGSELDDILFINDEGEMVYKRVPRTNTCYPQTNQVVDIEYPQYCSFTDSSGASGTWKATAFGSNIYKPANGLPGATVTTLGNCDPAPGSAVVSGSVILAWDANTL